MRLMRSGCETNRSFWYVIGMDGGVDNYQNNHILSTRAIAGYKLPNSETQCAARGDSRRPKPSQVIYYGTVSRQDMWTNQHLIPLLNHMSQARRHKSRVPLISPYPLVSVDCTILQYTPNETHPIFRIEAFLFLIYPTHFPGTLTSSQ